MPTHNEYETIKQQVLSFTQLHCLIKFDVEKGYKPGAFIAIIHNHKIYKFSDPDWKVISRQLNKLYFTIKGKNERDTGTRFMQ